MEYDKEYIVLFNGSLGILRYRLFGSFVEFEDGLYLASCVAPIGELLKGVVCEF